jgi:hypothetical protein
MRGSLGEVLLSFGRMQVNEHTEVGKWVSSCNFAINLHKHVDRVELEKDFDTADQLDK